MVERDVQHAHHHACLLSSFVCTLLITAILLLHFYQCVVLQSKGCFPFLSLTSIEHFVQPGKHTRQSRQSARQLWQSKGVTVRVYIYMSAKTLDIQPRVDIKGSSRLRVAAEQKKEGESVCVCDVVCTVCRCGPIAGESDEFVLRRENDIKIRQPARQQHTATAPETSANDRWA